MTNLEVVIRAGVIAVTLFIWARILGRRLISQKTFFDFVAGVTIGSVGANTMFNPQIKLWQGILGLSVFCFLVYLSDVITLKNRLARRLLDGESNLIIKNGEINEHAMKMSRISMDHLMMLLRKKNVFYVDEVDTAYLEIDGTITVNKKPINQPVSLLDLKLSRPSRGISHNLIMDGKRNRKSMAEAKVNNERLKTLLSGKGITSESDVLLAQMDDLGQLHLENSKAP